MNSTRLQKLHEFLNKEPDNPFLVYGLAMEYAKTDFLQASEYFEKLLKEHPEYLPTYYQYAHLLWEEEEIEKAKIIFESGIDLAEKQQEHKALHELKAAFHNFQIENLY